MDLPLKICTFAGLFGGSLDLGKIQKHILNSTYMLDSFVQLTELLQNENAAFLGEALANIIKSDEELCRGVEDKALVVIQMGLQSMW